MGLGTRRKNAAIDGEMAPAAGGVTKASPAVADRGSLFRVAVPEAAVPAPPVAQGVEQGSEGEVGELRAAVSELQSLVTSLVERAAPPADAPDAASRIVGAATAEAERAVAAARAEADEIVRQATAKSYEIIAVARELADRELDAERARVRRAATTWDQRRSVLAEQLASLEVEVGGHRDRMAGAVELIGQALLDLELPPEVAALGGDVAAADAPAAHASPTEHLAPPPSAAAPVATTAPAPQPVGEPVGAPAPVADAPKRSKLFGNGVGTPTSAAPSTPPSTPAPASGRQLRDGIFAR